MGIEERKRGAAVEKSCLKTSCHPTSLLSFPFPLSPPSPLKSYPSNPQTSNSSAIPAAAWWFAERKRETSMSKKSPGSAESFECPAMGEKKNLDHFSRNRPGWCLLCTQAVLEQGLSVKETRVLPCSLFWQPGAATPLFCGP